MQVMQFHTFENWFDELQFTFVKCLGCLVITMDIGACKC